MTQTTEDKARALVNEVLAETNKEPLPPILGERLASHEALCRLIEQHEAYKQEVSDALVWYFGSKEGCVSDALRDFIIPKPTVDPLVEAVGEAMQQHELYSKYELADSLRIILTKRGLKIVEDV